MAFPINNSTLRDYAEYCGAPRPADGQLHLVGISGCRIYTQNAGQITLSVQTPRPNQYDDLVGFFGTDFGLFPGTVDPGRYYSQNPLRPQGCAHTVSLDAPGGTVFKRVLGLHKGRKAFIQQGPIVIWRDTDKDMVQDTGEYPRSEILVGCNEHRMGDLEEDIQLWSAGCWGAMNDYWEELYARAAAPAQPAYLNWQFTGSKLGVWYDTVRTA
jgi:hypothetical protein